MNRLATLAFLSTALVPASSQSILDLAAADGKYGTFISAVTNTPGVLDTITSNMPVTVFGPTDSAFGDVSGVIAGLDQGALATVLAGHVVRGVFTAEDVIDAGCVELRTLSGADIRVAFQGGKVTVNDSTVVQADIIGQGGVAHGVNKVILPNTFQPCGDLATGKGSKKGSKKSSKKGLGASDSYDDDDSTSGSGKGGKGSRRRRRFRG